MNKNCWKQLIGTNSFETLKPKFQDPKIIINKRKYFHKHRVKKHTLVTKSISISTPQYSKLFTIGPINEKFCASLMGGPHMLILQYIAALR